MWKREARFRNMKVMRHLEGQQPSRSRWISSPNTARTRKTDVFYATPTGNNFECPFCRLEQTHTLLNEYCESTFTYHPPLRLGLDAIRSSNEEVTNSTTICRPTACIQDCNPPRTWQTLLVEAVANYREAVLTNRTALFLEKDVEIRSKGIDLHSRKVRISSAVSIQI